MRRPMARPFSRRALPLSTRAIRGTRWRRSPSGSPWRRNALVPAISDQAKLHLAALLIHCSGALDEAGKLLGGISGGLLSARRTPALAIAPGRSVAGARQARGGAQTVCRRRRKAGGRAPGVARAARLESAAILLAHSHWEDAQAALDRLQLDMPLERMSLDTGLLALNLAMGRKEFQRAFTDGQTLLALAGDDPRQSEILYTLVETGLALGKNEEAQRALGQLLKDFPYSESAAKAKDRWTKK